MSTILAWQPVPVPAPGYCLDHRPGKPAPRPSYSLLERAIILADLEIDLDRVVDTWARGQRRGYLSRRADAAASAGAP